MGELWPQRPFPPCFLGGFSGLADARIWISDHYVAKRRELMYIDSALLAPSPSPSHWPRAQSHEGRCNGKSGKNPPALSPHGGGVPFKIIFVLPFLKKPGSSGICIRVSPHKEVRVPLLCCREGKNHRKSAVVRRTIQEQRRGTRTSSVWKAR